MQAFNILQDGERGSGACQTRFDGFIGGGLVALSSSRHLLPTPWKRPALFLIYRRPIPFPCHDRNLANRSEHDSLSFVTVIEQVLFFVNRTMKFDKHVVTRFVFRESPAADSRGDTVDTIAKLSSTNNVKCQKLNGREIIHCDIIAQFNCHCQKHCFTFIRKGLLKVNQ